MHVGSGGFGMVKANYSNTVVAAKPLIPKSQQSGTVSWQYINDDVETLCRIRHPNLLLFWGIHIDESGSPYLVMEHVKGSMHELVESLKAKKRSLSIRQKLCMIMEVGRALGYLHNISVVHGNLSSSAVLLSKDLQVKVAYFGTNHTLGTQPSTSGPGFHLYKPREALTGEEVRTEKLDIFSLAVLFMELMNECHPRPLGTADSEQEKRMLDVRDFQRLAPKVLHGVVRQCLSDDPRKRQTANEVNSELEEILNSLLEVPLLAQQIECSDGHIQESSQFYSTSKNPETGVPQKRSLSSPQVNKVSSNRKGSMKLEKCPETLVSHPQSREESMIGQAQYSQPVVLRHFTTTEKMVDPEMVVRALDSKMSPLPINGEACTLSCNTSITSHDGSSKGQQSSECINLCYKKNKPNPSHPSDLVNCSKLAPNPLRHGEDFVHLVYTVYKCFCDLLFAQKTVVLSHNTQIHIFLSSSWSRFLHLVINGSVVAISTVLCGVTWQEQVVVFCRQIHPQQLTTCSTPSRVYPSSGFRNMMIAISKVLNAAVYRHGQSRKWGATCSIQLPTAPLSFSPSSPVPTGNYSSKPTEKLSQHSVVDANGIHCGYNPDVDFFRDKIPLSLWNAVIIIHYSVILQHPQSPCTHSTSAGVQSFLLPHERIDELDGITTYFCHLHAQLSNWRTVHCSITTLEGASPKEEANADKRQRLQSTILNPSDASIATGMVYQWASQTDEQNNVHKRHEGDNAGKGEEGDRGGKRKARKPGVMDTSETRETRNTVQSKVTHKLCPKRLDPYPFPPVNITSKSQQLNSVLEKSRLFSHIHKKAASLHKTSYSHKVIAMVQKLLDQHKPIRALSLTTSTNIIMISCCIVDQETTCQGISISIARKPSSRCRRERQRHTNAIIGRRETPGHYEAMISFVIRHVESSSSTAVEAPYAVPCITSTEDLTISCSRVNQDTRLAVIAKIPKAITNASTETNTVVSKWLRATVTATTQDQNSLACKECIKITSHVASHIVALVLCGMSEFIEQLSFCTISKVCHSLEIFFHTTVPGQEYQTGNTKFTPTTLCNLVLGVQETWWSSGRTYPPCMSALYHNIQSLKESPLSNISTTLLLMITSALSRSTIFFFLSVYGGGFSIPCSYEDHIKCHVRKWITTTSEAQAYGQTMDSSYEEVHSGIINNGQCLLSIESVTGLAPSSSHPAQTGPDCGSMCHRSPSKERDPIIKSINKTKKPRKWNVQSYSHGWSRERKLASCTIKDGALCLSYLQGKTDHIACIIDRSTTPGALLTCASKMLPDSGVEDYHHFVPVTWNSSSIQCLSSSPEVTLILREYWKRIRGDVSKHPSGIVGENRIRKLWITTTDHKYSVYPSNLLKQYNGLSHDNRPNLPRIPTISSHFSQSDIQTVVILNRGHEGWLLVTKVHTNAPNQNIPVPHTLSLDLNHQSVQVVSTPQSGRSTTSSGGSTGSSSSGSGNSGGGGSSETHSHDSGNKTPPSSPSKGGGGRRNGRGDGNEERKGGKDMDEVEKEEEEEGGEEEDELEDYGQQHLLFDNKPLLSNEVYAVVCQNNSPPLRCSLNFYQSVQMVSSSHSGSSITSSGGSDVSLNSDNGSNRNNGHSNDRGGNAPPTATCKGGRESTNGSSDGNKERNGGRERRDEKEEVPEEEEQGEKERLKEVEKEREQNQSTATALELPLNESTYESQQETPLQRAVKLLQTDTPTSDGPPAKQRDKSTGQDLGVASTHTHQSCSSDESKSETKQEKSYKCTPNLKSGKLAKRTEKSTPSIRCFCHNEEGSTEVDAIPYPCPIEEVGSSLPHLTDSVVQDSHSHHTQALPSPNTVFSKPVVITTPSHPYQPAVTDVDNKYNENVDVLSNQTSGPEIGECVSVVGGCLPSEYEDLLQPSVLASAFPPDSLPLFPVHHFHRDKKNGNDHESLDEKDWERDPIEAINQFSVEETSIPDESELLLGLQQPGRELVEPIQATEDTPSDPAFVGPRENHPVTVVDNNAKICILTSEDLKKMYPAESREPTAVLACYPISASDENQPPHTPDCSYLVSNY